MVKKKIAIVGGGISGMSAAYLLSGGGHEVTVFEKGDYLGGHTNTQDAKFGDLTVKADTGFLVFNEANYPNLVRLFEELGIETTNTDMSFSLSLNARQMPYDEHGNSVHVADSNNLISRPEVEWSSNGLLALFSQFKNVFSPSFWMMVVDMVRFHRQAPMILHEPHLYANVTINDFVKQHRYSQAFRNYYLVPVMSALWSTSFKDIDQFPILTLVRFFNNHGMMQLFRRPQWKTVKGCSYLYMRKLREILEARGSRVRLSTAVTNVTRTDSGIEIRTIDNETPEPFDEVIMACHPPALHTLVPDLTDAERDVLFKFSYTPSTAYLHSDPRLMPKRQSAWAAWNYLFDDHSSTERAVCVTYWINILQPWLDHSTTPLYLTLNPVFQPRPELVHKVIEYEHPLYNGESERSRERISSIQGTRHTFYAGAYYGFGFHEDGIVSGLLAAQAIDPSLEQLWKINHSRYIDRPPPRRTILSTIAQTIKVMVPTSTIILIAYLAYTKQSLAPILLPYIDKYLHFKK